MHSLDEDDLKINSLSWDPNNSTRFISGSGLSIRLWDTTMAKSVLTMQKHFSAGNGSIFV